MMSYSNSLLFREAGILINRPVTVRTIARSRHPRTGFTAFLLPLSASTELVIVNLISQHDPQPDPQLASSGHSRLPQTFLDQFATIETLQFRVSAYRVCRRLPPKKTQQRIALFAQATEPLPPSTGVFPRDNSHVTGHRLAASEPCWIPQEDVRRQRRDRPHSRVRHQQPCSGTMASLLLDSLV